MTDHLQDTGTIRAIRTVDQQPGRPTIGLATLTVGVALLVYGALSLLPARQTAPEAVVAAPAAQFAATGIGVTVRAATLTTRPAGATIAPIAAGTALRIGGRAKFPSGLGTREAYWVSPMDQEQRYGWLLDTEVLLTAGDAPLLTGQPTGAVVEAVRVVQAAQAPTAAPAAPTVVQAPVQSAAREIEIPWMVDTVRRWYDLFLAEGAEHNVDPELLAIICLVESGGNPRAVSPSGAIGLQQVMPATGIGIAKQRGLTASHATERLYEPAYNVDFSAWLLNQLLGQFGVADDPDWQMSVERAAMGYNGGPGGVTAPTAETRSYLRWVGGMWRERHQATSATFGEWMERGGSALVSRASAVQ